MEAKGIAIVAVFTALVVGTDFALAPFINIKLWDTIVFVVSFAFGFKKGAAVAVLSELIWSFVSPWGPAGVITPFLIGGELLFAAAGWGASRAWKLEGKGIYSVSLFIGATMAICAFIWDFEVNAVTALIWSWPHLALPNLVAVEVAGFLFPAPMAHEMLDLVLGTLVVPVTILMIPRVMRRS